MPLDARISTALPAHPKTKKLIRRHGPEAAWSLVCLFLWTAGNRSDGSLAGMADEDIELAADWNGDGGVFVKLLVDVGFLDGAENARSIHDWAEHNPWAAGAEDRSTASKWAALCKRYGRAIAAERMPEYAARMRPARDPDAADVRERCPVSDTVSVPVSDTVSVPVSDTVSNPPSSPQGEEHEQFADFWKAYPSRGSAANPRKLACKAFDAAIKRGADPAELIRLAATAAPADKHGTEFVPQAATWLNQDRWKDAPKPADDTFARTTDADLWRIRLETWAKNPKPPEQRFWHHDWGSPPHKGGSNIPAALVVEFNLDGMSPPRGCNRLAS